MAIPVNTPPPYYYQINEPAMTASQFVKDEVVKTKLYELYKKTDQSNSYQLTIPLLVSAQIEEMALYKDVLAKIYSNLGMTNGTTLAEFQPILTTWGEKASFNLWLTGRVLMAADNVQDHNTVNQVISFMQMGLASQYVNPFSTWAWGYLAVHYSSDAKEYPYYCQKMLEANAALKKQAGEKEKDNVQWAMVMDILAARSARDTETYYRLLQDLIEWTGKETVPEAILTIPPEDFTAWALAIVKVGAAKIKDIETYSALALPLEKALQGSPSEQDKLLAQVNNLLSEDLL